MKIALAQQNYHIGNFEFNTQKIISAIARARKDGAALIVFSELCVCGYPPRDLLGYEEFIDNCNHALATIAAQADTIGVLIGAPLRNENPKGKRLFNAAFLLYEKEIKGIVKKTLLPDYDIFDEYRYFEPAHDWNILEFKGKKLAITICEDIWNIGNEPLYNITPMEKLILQQPDLMVNLSASPYSCTQNQVRNSIVKAHTATYKIPMIYCNAVGAQTELIFDGGSLVYNAQGHKVFEGNYFKEDYYVVETDDLTQAASPDAPHVEEKIFLSAKDVKSGTDTLSYLRDEKNIAQIHQALVLGIKDYFGKMGFKKAILGSSGGLDSAVALALAVEALGAENVMAVLMPSQYSSSHSVSDAEKLSAHLENPYHILAIEPIYNAFLKELGPLFAGLPFNVAEENIQSRTRGNLLMAIANKFGQVLINTSNKSELATGYGTLYGDMAGGLSVLGDLYKTQVYALARFINRKKEIIPHHILTKAPSAELRPDQKDSDSLPPYDDLDTILFEYIENSRGPKEITELGHDATLVSKIIKMVNNNEYKRSQFCPILRVGYKAFGAGRNMPLVATHLS